MIEKAYGPQDFSYVYKNIAAVTQRLAAEDKFYRQEAKKQFATESAELYKNTEGIKEYDTSEIMDKYTKWKGIGTLLASNPNLINKNPKKYGELNSQYNELHAQIRAGVAASKTQKKEEEFIYNQLRDPSKGHYYREGAAGEYKREVIDKPLSYIKEKNTADPSRYLSETIDGKPFYERLDSNIKGAIDSEYPIPDGTKKSQHGISYFVNYKNVPTDLSRVLTAVDKSFEESGTTIPNKPKFAAQQLDKVIASGDYQKTVEEFNQFFDDKNPNGAKKYNLHGASADMFSTDPKKEPLTSYSHYIAAKEFLDRWRNPSKEAKEEKDTLAYGAYTRALNHAENVGMVMLRKSLDDKGEETAIVDFTPGLNIWAAGGTEGPKAAKQIVNVYNSSGFTDKIFAATGAARYKDNPIYQGGIQALKDANIGFKVVNDPNSPEGKEQLAKNAEKINENNAKVGVSNLKVTPQSISSGKILVNVSPSSTPGNPPVVIVSDVTDSNAIAYLSSKIKLPQMTAKQKREYVKSNVLSAIGQAPTINVEKPSIAGGKKTIKGF